MVTRVTAWTFLHNIFLTWKESKRLNVKWFPLLGIITTSISRTRVIESPVSCPVPVSFSHRRLQIIVLITSQFTSPLLLPIGIQRVKALFVRKRFDREESVVCLWRKLWLNYLIVLGFVRRNPSYKLCAYPINQNWFIKQMCRVSKSLATSRLKQLL